ncbi:MAG: TMEM175 family protein [Chloroflexota bacterium]|nr:TMEM175 family protein [Anaerolineales bacterium]
MAKKSNKQKQYGSESKSVSSPHNQLGIERLVFFSDAVFAIAITLLALEIRLPSLNEELSDGQLAQALLALWPKYLSYAISFWVIGSFWMTHHRKFRFIVRSNTGLMLLNLLLLMAVAFIPFPTSVISEYGNRTATIFYALAMTVVGLLSAAVWAYASHNNRLIEPAFTPGQTRRETLRALIPSAIFLLSIGLAFINDDLAKYSWLLIAVVPRFIWSTAETTE